MPEGWSSRFISATASCVRVRGDSFGGGVRSTVLSSSSSTSIPSSARRPCGRSIATTLLSLVDADGIGDFGSTRGAFPRALSELLTFWSSTLEPLPRWHNDPAREAYEGWPGELRRRGDALRLRLLLLRGIKRCLPLQDAMHYCESMRWISELPIFRHAGSIECPDHYL